MATKNAHDKGKNVTKSLPIRVDRNEAAGLDTRKHQAAVCPANHNARKVIPAKAAEEWPEGKDFLPFNIESSVLSKCYEIADKNGDKDDTQYSLEQPRPIDTVQENQVVDDL